MTSLPGCGRGLTCSEQVRDQSGQRPFQVELQQLDGLQAVCFLFLRRPPTASLKQGQVLAAPDPGEQLGQTGDIWIPTSQHVLAVHRHARRPKRGVLPRGRRRGGPPPSGGRRGSGWRRSRPACKRLRPAGRRPVRTSPAPSGGRRCERAASFSCSSVRHSVIFRCHVRCIVGGERRPSPVQVVVVSSFPAGVIGRDQQAVNHRRIHQFSSRLQTCPRRRGRL